MYKFGKISIICVGSLKEDFLRGAQAEFVKRLTPYGKLTITEIPASDTPAEDAPKILKALTPSSYKIALTLDGESPNSEQFAKNLENLGIKGNSHIEFIIGGSEGLDPSVLGGAQARLSISNMTFTHQLARIILLEQIYRAARILNNQPYHK
ncbi:MAG: 23S rRNA (pseudouridine(1915)-N(3))-methyltransferase RlmH [Defluviitaleaceae bacterium]|nr:23S rRNA (pseudouridine(1915)-N(3))-methyltransferase RlmH [Defluviitaleaceae bacterium]